MDKSTDRSFSFFFGNDVDAVTLSRGPTRARRR
jgi:hypothetical protein